MEHEISWQGMVEDYSRTGQNLADALLQKIHAAPPKGAEEQWRRDLQSMADAVPTEFLTHHMLRRLERHKVRVGRGLSFQRYMVEDSEIRKMRLKSLSWALNRKSVATRFADELGVRRPRSSSGYCRFDELEWQVPGVLKARSSTGSRGCYLMFAEDDIVHVRDGKRFPSREAMENHARRLMDPANRRRLPDSWIVEELILEDPLAKIPARDLKFYSFYGEIQFVLEVIRDGNDSVYSFKTPEGEAIRPGDWDYRYFDGEGADAQSFELAAQISREIPHPYMRIDMLRGQDEVVFGEFTPRPGGFHQFSPKWDRRLGEAWARANDRLQEDLLRGKTFEAFLKATNVYPDA